MIDLIRTYSAREVDRLLRRGNGFAIRNAVELGAFQLVFLWNVVRSARHGVPADNPWQATTLEWTTSSPPSRDNFDTLPEVTAGPYRYEDGPA